MSPEPEPETEPQEEKKPAARPPSQTQQRQEKERASKREEFQRQLDDGSLVTRKMTPEEREAMPPRPRPAKRERKR